MQKLLYFVNKWPFKNSSSSENIVFSLIGSFQDREYQPVIVSQNPPEPEKLNDVEEYTVETVSIKPNDMLKLPYQVQNVGLAVFDSVETSRRFSYDVYNKYNKIPQILFLKNVNKLTEYSRLQSLKTKALVNKNVKMWPQNLLIQEQDAIIRSDITIVLSQFLYYNMKPKYDNIIYGCEYLPTTTFIQEIENRDIRPFNRRKNFYFVGNLLNQHNKDCVERLIEIWPLISKQLPEQQLHIYSKFYYPQLYKRKGELQKINIILENEIEDAEIISKYRMLLAPFRYHVDSPGKITQAWFYHTPVITTPYGSQSMFQELVQMSLIKAKGRFLNQKIKLTEEEQYMQDQIRRYYSNNVIGEDNYNVNFGGLWKNYTNQQFAESVINLSKDEKLWNRCRQIGEQTVLANHSDDVHFKKVLGSIANVEYKRVVDNENAVRKQAWEKYLEKFAKERKSRKKGR